MNARSEELAQQQLWKLKPKFATLRIFDELLENEFLSADEQEAWQIRAVANLIRFAAVHTPYYARLFARLDLSAADIDGPESLAKLPILAKHDVLQFQDELTSRWLPPGEAVAGQSRSSGTTGRPVTVLHCRGSDAMFGLLRQRSSRWHRLDPARSRVDVRPRGEIFRHADGSLNPDGAIVRSESWRGLGEYFHTGPEFAFNVTTPMERQVALLQQLRPHYAMSYPGVFEEWLLANEGRVPVESLECLVGIGSQLTPSLRVRLEQSYGIPIHQGYGLNEIGTVASRCAAGRYHVHTEFCLVQIVTPDGRSCAPGEVGHVLVTGFRNLAMPLIRYDTGDLAEVASGPCPCGRTLPSFAEIVGRYRRYAGLPEGTRERVRAIRAAIENCPPDQLVFLRRYQIHQDRENRFALRLRTVAPVPGAFRRAVLDAWGPVAGTPPARLSIVEMSEIPTSPNGKLLDFASDFYTDSSVSPRPDGVDA